MDRFSAFPKTQAFSYNDVARASGAIAKEENAENAVREGKKTLFTEMISALCACFGWENPYAARNHGCFVDVDAIGLVTAILESANTSANYMEGPSPLKTSEPIGIDKEQNKNSYLRLAEIMDKKGEKAVAMFLCDMSRVDEPFDPARERKIYQRPNCSFEIINKSATEHPTSVMHAKAYLKLTRESQALEQRKEIEQRALLNTSAKSDNTSTQVNSNVNFSEQAKNRDEKTLLIHSGDVSRNLSKQEFLRSTKSPSMSQICGEYNARKEPVSTFPVRDWSQFKNGDKLSDIPASSDTPNPMKISNERVDRFLKLINITERVGSLDMQEFKKGLADKITDHEKPRASRYMDINGDRIKLSPTDDGMNIRILKNFSSIPHKYLRGHYQYGAPVGFISNLTFNDFQNLKSSSESKEFNLTEGLDYKDEIHDESKEFNLTEGLDYKDEIHEKITVNEKTSRERVNDVENILDSVLNTRLDYNNVKFICKLDDPQGVRLFSIPSIAHDSGLSSVIEICLRQINDGMLIQGYFENEGGSYIGFVPKLTFEELYQAQWIR